MCDAKKGSETLASTHGLGSVAVCGCGTISLNIQAMSLRMDLQSFELTLEMMREALRVMQTRPSLDSPPITHAVH